MFFLLSKIVYYLLMPVTLIVLAFLLSWVLKKYRKLFWYLGMFMLLLFTNLFISNAIMQWWEVDPTPIESLPKYKVGIVLGGITSDKEPRDRVHMTGEADRLLHALQLYREGKVDKILLSGGSGKLLVDSVSEAELLKKVLELSKVPKRDILIENRSRNTRENALYSAEILNEKYPNETYLLITSATHIRRAEACFRNVGLDVDTFGVGFRSEETKFTPDVLIIPSSAAIGQWEVLIKEMVGILAYSIAGYI